MAILGPVGVKVLRTGEGGLPDQVARRRGGVLGEGLRASGLNNSAYCISASSWAVNLSTGDASCGGVSPNKPGDTLRGVGDRLGVVTATPTSAGGTVDETCSIISWTKSLIDLVGDSGFGCASDSISS